MIHWRNIHLLPALVDSSDNLKDLLKTLLERNFINSYEEYHVRRIVAFFILARWEEVRLLEGDEESVKRTCLLCKNAVSEGVKDILENIHLRHISRTEILGAEFYFIKIIDFFVYQVCPSHPRPIECIDKEKD